MGLKPGIILNEQYQKLKEIALSAEHFQWDSDEPYTGPVRPAGIHLWMSSHHHLLKYWFVLAERLTAEHLPDYLLDDDSPFGYVALDLDNNLEFRDWDPVSKSFTKLYGCCGNDGTMWGDCRYYANNLKTHVSMVVLVFEHDGNVYTGNITQKVWPN
jgi:hypothetical protein